MTVVLPDPLRRHPLANRRDLGGIAVAGAHVRPGRLIRSDDVSFVDPAGARDIIDAGITLMPDLRSTREAQLSGPGPLRDLDIEHRHLPLSVDPALPGAGKDQAGVFAACLLTVLGAYPAAVRADYVRTNEKLPQILTRVQELVDRVSPQQLHIFSADTVLRSAPEAATITMFENLRQRRGGLLQVLYDAGLDQELIDTLRDRCLSR